MATPFQTVLNKFRKYAHSERDKGDKFERLKRTFPRRKDAFSK